MTTRSRQKHRGHTNKIPIIVVDSQVLFRRGIQRMLAVEEDVDILGDTDQIDEALSQIENLSPQIVMLDAGLTPHKSIDLAEVIHRRYPNVSVIVLSQEIEEQQIFLAMKAGVAAPLSKSAPTEEMVTVIRKISQGDLPIVENLLQRPTLAALVQEEFRLLSMMEETSQPLIAPLAGRESEILTQLVQGRSAGEIAAAMNIDSRALQTILLSILIKLANNKQTLDTVATRFQGP